MRITPHQKEVVNLMSRGWELQFLTLTMSYINLVRGDQKRPVRYATYDSLLKKGVIRMAGVDGHTTTYELAGGQ